MSETVIHELAANGEARQLEHMIRNGKVAFIDLPDNDFGGLTALCWAVKEGMIIAYYNNLKI